MNSNISDSCSFVHNNKPIRLVGKLLLIVNQKDQGKIIKLPVSLGDEEFVCLLEIVTVV